MDRKPAGLRRHSREPHRRQKGKRASGHSIADLQLAGEVAPFPRTGQKRLGRQVSARRMRRGVEVVAAPVVQLVGPDAPDFPRFGAATNDRLPEIQTPITH